MESAHKDQKLIAEMLNIESSQKARLEASADEMPSSSRLNPDTFVITLWWKRKERKSVMTEILDHCQKKLWQLRRCLHIHKSTLLESSEQMVSRDTGLEKYGWKLQLNAIIQIAIKSLKEYYTDHMEHAKCKKKC